MAFDLHDVFNLQDDVTPTVGGTTCLLASALESGISVFSAGATDAVINRANINDNAMLKIEGHPSPTTGFVRGMTCLLAGSGHAKNQPTGSSQNASAEAVSVNGVSRFGNSKPSESPANRAIGCLRDLEVRADQE